MRRGSCVICGGRLGGLRGRLRGWGLSCLGRVYGVSKIFRFEAEVLLCRTEGVNE